MIFIMCADDLEKVFLKNELDSVILESQFVIVSTRIRKRTNSNENIVVATKALFPGVDYYGVDPKSKAAKDAYFNQLDASRPFLAALVKGSIKKHYNIFFICSDKEWKYQRYLKYLKKYIIQKFAYPVYEYVKYVNGCALYEYDEEYTLKICRKILKTVKRESYLASRRTEVGRQRLMKGYKKQSSKSLAEKVKKMGLYHKGMRRDEMLEVIESFL